MALKRHKPKTVKPKPPRGIGRFFLRGLVTLLPVVLTLVVFGLAYQMVDRYVTGPINSVIYWSLEGNTLGWKGLDRLGIDPLAPEYINPDSLPLELENVARNSPAGYASPEFLNALRNYRHDRLSFFRGKEDLCIHPERLRNDVSAVVHPLVGVFVSLLLVLWLGWLVGGFVGRRIVGRLDQALHFIPIVKSIYPYSKQLVEFFFAERQIEFETVVAVPYPSPGLWSIAFVTSTALKTLREATERNLVSVFVPSSPMPMTGYTIFVEAERLVPLPITVDEALRVTMTGGVLIPPHERVEELLEEVEDAVRAHEESA